MSLSIARKRERNALLRYAVYPYKLQDCEILRDFARWGGGALRECPPFVKFPSPPVTSRCLADHRTSPENCGRGGGGEGEAAASPSRGSDFIFEAQNSGGSGASLGAPCPDYSGRVTSRLHPVRDFVTDGDWRTRSRITA